MFFSNIFSTGGGQAASTQNTVQGVHGTTFGDRGNSADLRAWDIQYGPRSLPNVPHEALNLMEGWFPNFFGSSQAAFTKQDKDSENPSTTSDVASSTRDTANKSVSADISDKDLPTADSLKKLMGRPPTAYALIATGLGNSEGLAVDPSLKPATAYVSDRSGGKLTAVKLDTYPQDVVATGLGDITDVKVDGKGMAYGAVWNGSRFIAVKLSDGTSKKLADIPGAHGIALDGTGNAIVSGWSDGLLYKVSLTDGTSSKINPNNSLGQGISGVALDGQGYAYVGQKDNGGKLWKVNLTDGTNILLTDLTGQSASTTRVELDGTGKAYVLDYIGGRLYEVGLTDGAWRVVASGLGNSGGLALDTAHGYIYISNAQGQLWQIDLTAARAPGGVGKVVAPPA
ncbi:hypothetical protein ACFY2W_34390 [Streptomyces sp. NPDC001262]|uniref:hypothetical protein n=1 Tax=unclassified Streptomyces TaxID=2593676 RepID=UPI00367D3D9B